MVNSPWLNFIHFSCMPDSSQTQTPRGRRSRSDLEIGDLAGRFGGGNRRLHGDGFRVTHGRPAPSAWEDWKVWIYQSWRIKAAGHLRKGPDPYTIQKKSSFKSRNRIEAPWMWLQRHLNIIRAQGPKGLFWLRSNNGFLLWVYIPH